MRFCEFIVILFVFIALPTGAEGQQLKENEIVVIRGEKYILHQVRTGETIYSISKQFKVDSLTLVTQNPKLSEEGLKIGQILKIPYHEDAEIQNEPVFKKGDPVKFEFHTITSRRETPYFIAREYGITVEEIYAYNPEIQHFKKGSKIRIPIWDAEPESTEETVKAKEEVDKQETKEKLIRHVVTSGETLFSISGKYNISESEILFYNPDARDLKAGSIIYIPRKEGTADTEPTAPEEDSQPDKLPEPVTGRYFDHTIISGETLWGITRKFDVTEKELKELNPILESDFPAGVTLKIPVKEDNLINAEPINKEAFTTHVVKPGETLFGLASQYKITIPAIKKFNPQLEKRNLVSGESILIPRTPDREIIRFMESKTADSVKFEHKLYDSEYYEINVAGKIPDICRPSNFVKSSKQVYNIALFLPLFIMNNDTLNNKPGNNGAGKDTVQVEIDIEVMDPDTANEDEPHEVFYTFYRDSENFIKFYEGVLLAVDSMQRAGMNIRLNVFDSQLNPDSVMRHIHSNKFWQTDLIIGPVYPQIQKEVSAIAAKNRIPVVSPLSSRSTEIKSNPFYYQVNPARDLLALKTAELIVEEYFNSNFIVFNIGDNDGSSERKVPDMVKERLFNSGYWGRPDGFNFRIYNFSDEGPFGLSHILRHDKENVIFIPSMDEGDISVALSNIDNLSKDYPITLIGFNFYQQFSSINIEWFHNLKLHYVAPYWINYEDPTTIRFIEKYKDNFHTEPDNFSMQGYDVAFYFLNALNNYGKDFDECLPYMQIDLIQGDYSFEKVSRFGGYMNYGVSVISYEQNYDVVRKRIIGQYPVVQK